MKAPEVLLVEDDRGIARVICEGLSASGFKVHHAASIAAADAMSSAHYDLGVFDVTLPDGSGLDFLTDCRHRGNTMPVCFLTARDTLEDKLAGFSAGGDDYLVKPFELAELVIRLRALHKRASAGTSSEPSDPALANLVLSRATRELLVDGRAVELTKREFDVLQTLMIRSGKAVSRDQLLSTAWPSGRDVNQNTVDVYISYLRRKLENAGARAEIATVRAVGFKLIESGSGS